MMPVPALGAVLALVMMTGAAVASDALDRTTRTEILEAARIPVTEALRKRVLFKVERLHAERGWAFVAAGMREPDGRPVAYAGTPLAEEARQGFVSRSFAALLRRDWARWVVVAKAIGPTDVPWVTWAADYGAPAGLFDE